jgi:hypothetical protein
MHIICQPVRHFHWEFMTVYGILINPLASRARVKK